MRTQRPLPEGFVSVAEAMKMLGYRSRRWMYALIERGRLTRYVLPVNGVTVLRRDEVEALLAVRQP
jgi:hypothetical protein